MAGIFTKTALAIQHRQIAPHLHLRAINPYIDSAPEPFQVPQASWLWRQIAGRRLAGVSAFGFGGTNAHVVLEELPRANGEKANISAEPPASLLTFSARSREALKSCVGPTLSFSFFAPGGLAPVTFCLYRAI